NAQSDGVLVATSPPGVGVQQITVTNQAAGTSAFTTAANFTYVSGPVVQSLNPQSGPPQGGTVVTIQGSGFAPGASVTFGGVAATGVIFDSSTVLRATSPAGQGAVDVVVTVG